MTDVARHTGTTAVQVDISEERATIENSLLAVQFDLSAGTYTGTSKLDDAVVFKDAWFRLGQGGWTAAQGGYGDGTPTNSSPALVEQMQIAIDKDITKYTPVAVRITFSEFGRFPLPFPAVMVRLSCRIW